MIRRKTLTIFTDAKNTTTVLELKKIIEGFLKIPPQDQQLFNKDNTIMVDDRMLQDYGLTSTTTTAQNPATVGLAVRCWQNFIMTTLSASSTRQIFCAGHKELQHPTFIQMQDHRIIWSQKPQNVFSRIRNFPLIGLTGNCIRYKYLSLIN
ncbi:elongin-B-like isoform X2 [Zophobas morio]